MIATVQELFQKEPELTSRILWYWSNTFSAAVSCYHSFGSHYEEVVLIGDFCRSLCACWCLEPLLLVCRPRPCRICKGQDCCSELERKFVLELPKSWSALKTLNIFWITMLTNFLQPILETMVDKANDIYFRWSNGQELPTIVLRHITEDGTSYAPGDEPDSERRSPSVPPEDPFLFTHQSLAQCIGEVHQIARNMFPLRKPCNCSSRAAQPSNTNGANGVGKQSAPAYNARSSPSHAAATMVQPECPPSHEWSPPPIVNGTSPVLPDAPPVGYMRTGPVVAVGYPTYNDNKRMKGASSYSSLSGSGMSPSPSPPIYGQSMGSSTFGNGSPTYNGYTNGAPQGMYSPSSTNSTVTYAKPSSPAYVTPGVPTPPKSQTPLQNHYPQQPQRQRPLASPVHSSSNASAGPGFYTSVAVLPASGPPVLLPPPSSKLAIVDTINFELGALSANNEQSFMVFY